MNANIMQTLFFNIMIYDFKGHGRPHKAILSNTFIYQQIWIKVSMNANMMKTLSMTLKVT